MVNIETAHVFPFVGPLTHENRDGAALRKKVFSFLNNLILMAGEDNQWWVEVELLMKACCNNPTVVGRQIAYRTAAKLSGYYLSGIALADLEHIVWMSP